MAQCLGNTRTIKTSLSFVHLILTIV